MTEYIALFEYDDGEGFSVVFPDLPGLVTAGDTYENTRLMARDALAEHIEFLEDEGENVPEPRTVEEIIHTWEYWKEWQANYHFMVVPIDYAPLNVLKTA